MKTPTTDMKLPIIKGCRHRIPTANQLPKYPQCQFIVSQQDDHLDRCLRQWTLYLLPQGKKYIRTTTTKSQGDRHRLQWIVSTLHKEGKYTNDLFSNQQDKLQQPNLHQGGIPRVHHQVQCLVPIQIVDLVRQISSRN